MFNHARTLLLNVSGSNRPGADFPGEEAVPSAYAAFAFSSTLAKMRRILFGSSPDRVTLNYRLRQYLTLLHATELEEYVLSLDSRVTYWPCSRSDFVANIFGVTVSALSDSNKALYIQGEVQADDTTGCSRTSWRVEVIDGATAKVDRDTPPSDSSVQSYSVSSGLSSPVALTGSGLYCRFKPDVGSAWVVEATARPQRELGDIVETLQQSLSDDDLTFLFGSQPAEPYKTFRNLWLLHEWLAYRLGGLLLAVVYRSDEAWRRP